MAPLREVIACGEGGVWRGLQVTPGSLSRHSAVPTTQGRGVSPPAQARGAVPWGQGTRLVRSRTCAGSRLRTAPRRSARGAAQRAVARSSPCRRTARWLCPACGRRGIGVQVQRGCRGRGGWRGRSVQGRRPEMRVDTPPDRRGRSTPDCDINAVQVHHSRAMVHGTVHQPAHAPGYARQARCPPSSPPCWRP